MAGLAELATRLSAIQTQLSALDTESAGGADAGGSPPSVSEFDALLESHLTPWVAVATVCGGDMSKIAGLVKECFLSERDFLALVSACKKPSDEDFMSLLSGVSSSLSKVQEVKPHKTDAQAKQCSMVGEAIPAMGWVTVSPTPVPYLDDMIGAGDYYGNQVLRDFKDKDENQVNFVKMFKALLLELKAYVKKHHTTGLAWNPKGVATSEYSPGASAAPAVASKSSSASVPATTEGVLAALVAAVEAITARLGNMPASAAPAAAVDNGSGAAVAPMVADYEKLMADFLEPWCDATKKCGDKMPALADAVKETFAAQKEMLEKVASCKKPSDEVFMKLLTATSNAMGKAQGVSTDNRSPLTNHFKCVSEGIAALGWVTVSPAPAPYLDDMIGSGDFYGIKAIREFKDKDENQCVAVRKFKELLLELKVYVKKHHTTGLYWNPRGEECK